MKSYALIWACLLWLPFQLFSQDANYRLEIEVLMADENSDLFVPLQTYSYSLAPQTFRQSMLLPSTAGRIRLQTYLMSGLTKVDIYDLLVNGVKSSDRESFVIENPLAWIQRGEPLMIVFAEKPYSYYKLNVPIQWSNVTERAVMPQVTATTPQNYDAVAGLATKSSNQTAYIPPGLSIQIEARKDLPDLQKFTALQSFGTVYYREDPNWYRVRVGSFTNRNEALEIRDAIRKAQNGAFNRAFLINEEGGYVVHLTNHSGIPAASAVPQGYDSAAGGRINVDPAPATTNLTARGGVATQPMPRGYESAPQQNQNTLANRAPKFPDWYYNSTTAVTAPEPEPTSYDAILNSPLPKAYDTSGGLTAKGVATPKAGYYVQTGAYGNYNNAQRALDKLVRLGITNAQITQVNKPNGEIIFRTWIGPYRTQVTANNQKASLAKNLKIAGTVVSGN